MECGLCDSAHSERTGHSRENEAGRIADKDSHGMAALPFCHWSGFGLSAGDQRPILKTLERLASTSRKGGCYLG